MALSCLPLDEVQRGQSPFDDVLCRELFETGSQLEARLGTALDIEWTYSDKSLHILQARPITALYSPKRVMNGPGT